MSLNWDNIDSRQLKAKQEAKDLKNFLQAQQEETKKRRQQERTNERESYKSNVYGQSFEQKMQTTSQRNATELISQSSLNAVAPLPKIVDTKAGQSRITFLEDQKPVQEYDYTATDNFLSKLRDTESQIISERKSHELQSELQNTKLLINTLSAKFELLQEQSRNENSNFRELNRELEKRDRQSRDAIEQLNRKLDQEAKRVHVLVEELSKSRQKEMLHDSSNQDQLKEMHKKVEQLTARLEGFVHQTQQVGATLNSASTQLQIEARRNEETVKAVQMHEHALTSLSSNMDSSVNVFTNRIQMAAQDLFQKIEGEAKARKGLEESIRQDAMEFRRMIERHIAERVDSVKSYTQVQGEHDRQAIEAVSNSFHSKLKRLEESTGGSLEQIGTLLNQRVAVVEHAIEESEATNKKFETRLQTSMTESLQYLEALIVKRDGDSEKRLKEVSKSILAVQRAIHDSISISEKSLGKKIKGVEEVLRAEITARLEIDRRLSGLESDTNSTFKSQQSQIQKLLEMLEESKRDQEKTMEFVKSVTQQLTRSQDKWVEAFDGEVLKLNNNLEKQSSSINSFITQTKDQILLTHDIFVTETQENHAQIMLDIEESKEDSKKVKALLNKIEANIETKTEEVEKKMNTRYAQVDATLDAFKSEFAARPTKVVLEDRIAELEGELEAKQKSLRKEIEQLAEQQKLYVEVGVVDSLDREVDQFKIAYRKKISEFEESVAKSTLEWQTFKDGDEFQRKEQLSKMEHIIVKQEDLAEQIVKNEIALDQFKVVTNGSILATKESILGYENQLESFQSIVQESKDLIHSLDEQVKLSQEQAKARDARITALSEEINSESENLSRKIIESADKQSKTSANINIEIQRIAEDVLMNKSHIERSSEQIVHLREGAEAMIKSTKQGIAETSKNLDELAISTQTQLEANARKISLLTLNLESSILQNQNEHALIQEDLAFAKRSLGESRDNAQDQKSDDLETQLHRSNMVIEETRKDLELISKKTQALERTTNTKFGEYDDSAEKKALEYNSQVKQLKNLVAQTQEQLNLKAESHSATIDRLERDVDELKASVNQVEMNNFRLNGDLKRISGDLEASKSAYTPRNLKSPNTGTTPRTASRVELNEEVQDNTFPRQQSANNIEF